MATRRLLGLATAAVVAGSLALPLSPADACDPNRFPNCNTYCGWVAWRYRELVGMTDPPLPDWPRTGVAGCP